MGVPSLKRAIWSRDYLFSYFQELTTNLLKYYMDMTQKCTSFCTAISHSDRQHFCSDHRWVRNLNTLHST